MSHLEKLGTQFSIPISPDDDGYLGRECPIDECLGYFKIRPGTGVKGPAPCDCPYCGHKGRTEPSLPKSRLNTRNRSYCDRCYRPTGPAPSEAPDGQLMVAFSRDGEPNEVTIAKDGQKAHKIELLAIAPRD